MTEQPPTPLAFSGSRLGWADLPRAVRRRIAEMAGAEVTAEASATNGFSPGYAAVLDLADGTQVFVKAVSPEQNPDSPDLARAEMRASEHVPDGVCAPELLWSDDDGTWVLLGFAPVHGRTPESPWRADELSRVLEAVAELADNGTPFSGRLPPLAAGLARFMSGWRALAQDGAALDRAVDAAGAHGAWLRAHLDELCELETEGPRAATGTTLVHNDLRADNILLDADDERVWLIDWPHASADGARWFDLLGMLPSVAMQGGGDPAEHFWRHPNARGADRDAVRAALAGLAGYFVHGSVQPPPRGIANLRAFQGAQGRAALAWLSTF
ncbi:phosphotransferase family protein [Cellulomonas sp. APG4]|uniref:phosphotransferase family protein n=1 Tax=Cellulomonas sp. APG4 TaxID=1538656 RepID=UPI00351AB6C5